MSTGMEWLRQSCRIMAKAPLAIFGVLGIYILLLFIANIPGEYLKIPYAGILISSIVTPFSALAFAGCGRELTQGRIPTAIGCYAEGFKNPAVRNKLILLGLIYGLCVIVINFIVQALSAPAIEQWEAVNGVYDTASILSHLPWAGLIVGSVLYVTLLGVTCFSPMLIAWRGMPMAKAFFFSLIVCFRILGPIVTLGLLLFLMATGGAVVCSSLGGFGEMLGIIWALFITALSYGSLYPMWRSVFEPDTRPIS